MTNSHTLGATAFPTTTFPPNSWERDGYREPELLLTRMNEGEA